MQKKENLEWGKQVGNNRENETEIDLLPVSYTHLDVYKRQPQKGAADKDSWIEITFDLSKSEYESLADTYKYESDTLRVKKYFKTSEKLSDGKSAKGVIVGMTSDGIYSTEAFYGAKNVQNGKLGNVIYIPAVSRVDDITKMSGPSALRDLISSIMRCV